MAGQVGWPGLSVAPHPGSAVPGGAGPQRAETIRRSSANISATTAMVNDNAAPVRSPVDAAAEHVSAPASAAQPTTALLRPPCRRRAAASARRRTFSAS